MNKTTIISLLFLVGATLMLTTTTVAQEDSQETTGGDITENQLSQTDDASAWVGFYGAVDSSATLEDGGNTFFEWTVDDVSDSIVYAVDQTDSVNPTTVGLVDVESGDDADTVTGIDSGTEAASNTYVDNNGDFQILSTPNVGATSDLTDTAGVETLTGSTDSDSFTSFLAMTETDASSASPVYFTQVLNEGDGFDDSLHDYQLLAGTGEDNTVTFDFYVEIS